MTITIAPARNEYQANAGDTIFNFTFKIFENTDLNVYITPAGQEANDSTDLTTAYSVTGLGNESGGSITLSTPTNANDLVTIVSNVPSSRAVDYQNNGDFRPDTVNADFDRVVSIAKKIEDTSNRGLLLPQSQQDPKPLSLPTPESQQLLRWKSDLSGMENVTLAELDPELIPSTSVSYIFNTVLDMTSSEIVFDFNKVLETKGEALVGDGKGATYLVSAVSSTPNDEILNDGKFAVWQQRQSTQSSYDNSSSGLDATNTQEAIDKLVSVGGIIQYPDMVQKALEQVDIRGMYYRAEATKFFVGIGMNADFGSVVEYEFEVNGDGLLLLQGGFAGIEKESDATQQGTLVGTFIDGGSVGSRTTTVGDKITGSFTGQYMAFKHYGDNRGGVWKITLENGLTRNYSTWRTSAGVVDYVKLFEGLPQDTYQYEMEFIGDDPFNAPSGGTSRGWVYQSAGDATLHPIKFMKVAPIDLSTASDILSSRTIPDFAILARPKDAAYASQWVPDHGVSGVSVNTTTWVHVDGIRIFNSSAMSVIANTECESFLLSQEFDAVNPNGADGTMWKHRVAHAISKDKPYCSIINRLEFQQDTRLSQTYLAMNACRTSDSQRFIMNDRYEQEAPLPTDGSEQYPPIKATGGMWAGVSRFDSNNWCASINRVSTLFEANGLGDDWQAPNNRIHFRTDDVAKLYWLATPNNYDMASGEYLSCQNDIFVVAGIRFPNTMLRNI